MAISRRRNQKKKRKQSKTQNLLERYPSTSNMEDNDSSDNNSISADQEQQQVEESHSPSHSTENDTVEQEEEEEEEDESVEEDREETEREFLRRILRKMFGRIKSGRLDLGDGVWDEEENHFTPYFPELLELAKEFLLQGLPNHDWDHFELFNEDDDNISWLDNLVASHRQEVDALIQALARRTIKNLCLSGAFNAQVVQSCAWHFYEERRRGSGGGDGSLLEELRVTCSHLFYETNGIPLNCPLFCIAKKVSLELERFWFVDRPVRRLETAFQNIRRALQQPVQPQDHCPNVTTLFEIKFGSLLQNNHNASIALQELSSLSYDFPFINTAIDFEWEPQQDLSKFISDIPNLTSLTLNVRESAMFGPRDPLPNHALPTEYCCKITKAIREASALETLHLGPKWNRDGRSYGDGYTDLIKAVVAGLDKNKSLRKLAIRGDCTSYHDILWSSLAKNNDAQLESLEFVLNESDALMVWEGLEKNSLLLDIKFHCTPEATKLYDFLDPLLQRNKLLLEAKKYSRYERTPHEFLLKLGSLTDEPVSYFHSAADNISKCDIVRRTRYGSMFMKYMEELPPLPASFSALFVIVRKYLPHFANESIFIHTPLKDATEEELRLIDFDAYGDISGESPETIRRIWDEMTRRNRQMSRRIRELEHNTAVEPESVATE